jgi:hypothetical protein
MSFSAQFESLLSEMHAQLAFSPQNSLHGGGGPGVARRRPTIVRGTVNPLVLLATTTRLKRFARLGAMVLKSVRHEVIPVERQFSKERILLGCCRRAMP